MSCSLPSSESSLSRCIARCWSARRVCSRQQGGGARVAGEKIIGAKREESGLEGQLCMHALPEELSITDCFHRHALHAASAAPVPMGFSGRTHSPAVWNHDQGSGHCDAWEKRMCLPLLFHHW